MPHALLYAKSLSLLLEEVQSGADMTMVRSGLLRVRRFSRSHGVSIELSAGRMTVDETKLTRPLPGLQRLQLAMSAHGVAQISISAGALPRELLTLAMLLVRPRATDSDAPGVFEELRDAGLWSVQCYPVARTSTPEQAESYAADVGLDSPSAISTRGAALSQAAAAALRGNDIATLARVLASLVAIESAVTHSELEPTWSAVFDACATREALQALVTALPTCGDAIASAIVVLKRSGDLGAELLLDELLTGASMDGRRACFDALIEIGRGTTKLIEMLEHDQWFAVRNAACLLGAFRSRSSEPELTNALKHEDERVRAAVVSALLLLDTASSRATVRGAIRDSSPEVRRRAVRGFLAEAGAPNSVEKLLAALEREMELDVQLEFLYALGTLATPDAVQKLIRLCSVEGRYRPPDFRIAAAEALASARLSAAVPLLRAMLKDPDQHARAAARHLIRAVS
jgi:HEAT repeat protein